MLAVELRFEMRHASPRANESDDAFGLMGAFLQNGSLADGGSLIRTSIGWIIYGMAPGRDAFRRANWNEYVQSSVAQFKTRGLRKVTARFLGKVIETIAACRCKRREGYFLFTTFLSVEPPLRCISCGGTVPSYAISGLWSLGLRSWMSQYQACDSLNMACSTGERFAINQMAKLNSTLTRAGRELCEEIGELTGLPVFYFVYQDNTPREDPKLNAKCPGCRRLWLLDKPLLGKFDSKCDSCRLISIRP